MDMLRKLGLDPNLLSEEDIKSLNDVADKIRLNSNPNEMLSQLRRHGVDIDSIIKRLKPKVEPKKSSRVKRNEKCPCGSGEKYKKCCGNCG